MDNYMTTKEAAKLWKTSEANVRAFCRRKSIADTVNRAGRWFIPADSPRPANLPVLSDKQSALPVGVGTKDFKTFSSRMYYVDKTLMLRDIIDKETGIFLFTRPRRFGKSLNMSMIQTFFERTEEDTAAYFEDKKIWNCGEVYRLEQGQYPVISLNFKTARGTSWKEAYYKLCGILAAEVKRHKALKCSEKCAEDYNELLEKTEANGEGNYDFENTLQDLSLLLAEHFDSQVVVIIDEYDVPIQEGYLNGYYTQVTRFLRSLFEAGLKDNDVVKFGFLTGILQTAKEGILSGLNNLRVRSILDTEFSTYFGYTADELREMAAEYHAEDKMDEIRTWYNGYVFGGTEIYNPWSVANYFDLGCKTGTYWLHTSGNELVGELIGAARPETAAELEKLMNGQTTRATVDVRMVYPELKDNPSSVFSFLLATGYLKAIDNPLVRNKAVCTLAIPNFEIREVFKEEILKHFVPKKQQTTAQTILEALERNDWETVKKSLRTYLLQSASYFDTAVEGAYQFFMLGFGTSLSDYYFTSNRESGDGRYDVELEPRSKGKPGILLELKAVKKEEFSEENLHAAAEDALEQINRMHYDVNLRKRGIHTIYKYGMAFCGKHVDVVSETKDNDLEE